MNEDAFSDAVSEAVDLHVDAFSAGVSAALVGLTVTSARGEVWDSDGRWSLSLKLSDGTSVHVPGTTFAHGPLAELVRMAGGVPECDPVDVGTWTYEGEDD